MTIQFDETRSHALNRYKEIYAAVVAAGGTTSPPYDLSPREMTVLGEMTKGLSDLQIAQALGVTKFTINKHVGAILTKMNATSRTGAAVRAIREHIVT